LRAELINSTLSSNEKKNILQELLLQDSEMQ